MNAKVPINLHARETEKKKPATFGQKRAEQLESRLEKALTERRKLAAAENASEDPLKTHISKRGNMVERGINRLQKLLKDK